MPAVAGEVVERAARQRQERQVELEREVRHARTDPSPPYTPSTRGGSSPAMISRTTSSMRLVGLEFAHRRCRQPLGDRRAGIETDDGGSGALVHHDQHAGAVAQKAAARSARPPARPRARASPRERAGMSSRPSTATRRRSPTPPITSESQCAPTCIREYATAAANGATTSPATPDSRATPVANPAALAEWPDGNDGVVGYARSRRAIGTSLKAGRRPSKKLFTRTSETTPAVIIDPIPRSAARRWPSTNSAPQSSTRARPGRRRG